MNRTFINRSIYCNTDKLEKLINDKSWLDEKEEKNKFKKWNCVKFNFKKCSKNLCLWDYIYSWMKFHQI